MALPFADKLDALRDRFERLSERERAMVTGLGIAAVIMVTLIFGFLATDALAAREERNADMRQALRDIDAKRDSWRKAKEKLAAVESRLPHGDFALGGYIESAAKEAGIDIPESNPQPSKPAGKAYVESAVELRLNKVKLDALANFLRRLESGQTMVAVTALNIRTRDDKHQELDVELTVSTWERASEKKGGGKKDKGDKGDKG